MCTRRYKSLEQDLDTFIKAQLVLFHKQGIDNGSIRRLQVGFEAPSIFKATRFACRYLRGRGGNSGIRVIYAYSQQKDSIVFIEMYFKGDKANEDRKRIAKYFGATPSTE